MPQSKPMQPPGPLPSLHPKSAPQSHSHAPQVVKSEAQYTEQLCTTCAQELVAEFASW